MVELKKTNYYYCVIDNNVIFYVRSASCDTAGISVYRNMKEGDYNFEYFYNNGVTDQPSQSWIMRNPKSTVKELFVLICLDIISRVDIGIVNWKNGPLTTVDCMNFDSLKEFMEFLECNM